MDKTILLHSFLNFQAVHKQYELSAKYQKLYTAENQTLRAEVSNLRKQNKRSCDLKRLQKDFKDAKILGSSLKYEVNNLATQNLFLRNK